MHPFVRLMKKIEGAGTFSAFGKLDPVLPGLVIKEMGEVSLPLSENQAKEIIQKCEQAPFGRGEETLIDTSVRNVWQISPKALEFTNPQWNAAIEETCKKIAKQLGLSTCKVDFELYKLLVYAKGSFFLEHRDTEKASNMFATLVVNLPSPHEGGELIIRHGDQTNRYSFAGKNKFNPEYAVFYADCYHQVKPVISGYRLCLIYNLKLANRNEQPLLSQQAPIIEQIDEYVKKWTKSGDMVAYLLDHSYSEQNLSMANLKNNDFSRASILLKLAEKNRCRAFLCLVSYLRESYGDCWDGSFEEYEVSCEEVYAHHLLDPLGENLGIEHLNLQEDKLIAEIPLRMGPGREESISEATGNEGATKELWYHRGAVILWSEEKDLEIALEADLSYAICYLKKLIQNYDVSKGEVRQKASLLAHRIIDSRNLWQLDDITDSFIALGDIEALKKLLHQQAKRGLTKINPQMLVKMLDQFSWQTFATDLNAIIKENTRGYQGRQALPWIRKLLFTRPTSQESYPLITQWFQDLWKPALSTDNIEERREALSEIFQILPLLGKLSLTDEVLFSLADNKTPLSLPYVYASALLRALGAYKKNDILKKIAEHFKGLAKTMYPVLPLPPRNWQRQGQINCVCEFCREINQFLQDPDRNTLSIEKTLRRNLTHIETKIVENTLDLDIRINKQASKFTGAVTKNQKSYEQALQRFTLIEQAQKDIESWMGK